MKDVTKKHSKFGPGGINCCCCGPAPGKDRKRYFRQVKKKERLESMRLEKLSEEGSDEDDI